MALQRQFVLPPPPNPDDDVNGYSWRDWFRQLRDYIVNKGLILWSQIDFTGSKLSDIVNRPHNVLQSIQGGNSTLSQYYHLTDVEYTGTGTGVFVRQNNPTITSPNVDNIDFDTTIAAPTRQSGRLFWDNADGNQTLSLYMAGTNATMQIGEEIYYRIKATSAITEGQVVMFTGSVGASGALTGAPATGLTSETASYIMGVATEDIALNSWGYVTAFGLVRGFNTSGGAEAWVDGQILYYNPSVAGGLTKTVPTAPNAKIQVCAVVNAASGGSGSVFVRPTYGGKLGQFEGDVGITSATSGDLLQYDGTKWVNVTASSVIANTATAPVTKTADFTVAATDKWLINNKSGSTCTVTLPTASSYTGRELHFQNYQNYTVVSASSNVVPIVGGSATTAILADIAGDTCTLVSDGTNWVMTQYTPNNVLLI